jgi:fumarylacetoacetate (FAA) hydrolase family protein
MEKLAIRYQEWAAVYADQQMIDRDANCLTAASDVQHLAAAHSARARSFLFRLINKETENG